MDNSSDVECSRLEAGFGAIDIKPRAISLEIQATARHATNSDILEKDLDMDFDPPKNHLLSNLTTSLQGILPALQYSSQMENLDNFSETTSIQCFEQTGDNARWLTLDDANLEALLGTVNLNAMNEHTCGHSQVKHFPIHSTKKEDSVTEAQAKPPITPSKASVHVSGSTQITKRPLAESQCEIIPAVSGRGPPVTPQLDTGERSHEGLSLASVQESEARVPLQRTIYQTYITSTTEAEGATMKARPGSSSVTPAPKERQQKIENRASSPNPELVLEPEVVAYTDGSKVSLQRTSVHNLFGTFDMNSEFLLNLLGRPDYWSPRSRWQYDMKDELTSCDYFCQYPRWNVQSQGAPLSVYVKRQVKAKLTVYVISHKVGDSSIHALQELLKSGSKLFSIDQNSLGYCSDPFDLHQSIMSRDIDDTCGSREVTIVQVLSSYGPNVSQVNKVDDHLAGLVTSGRGHLTELTKGLQVISQQADYHLLNANVAIISARGVCAAQTKFHDHLSTARMFRQPAEDMINYVIDSLEKQKALFLNYKSRKDGTMSLVYNLVTQSDAANNIQLAQSMNHDSTSMSAIACLTMLFLPGTFTSSILSAGIFSARENAQGISTSRMWWFWTAITIPLTLIVLGAWYTYRKKTADMHSNPENRAPGSQPEPGVAAVFPRWLAFLGRLAGRTQQKPRGDALETA